MTTELKTIARNTFSTEGDITIHMITFSDQPVPLVSLAIAVGLSKDATYRTLVMNGGRELNGVIVFDSEEQANSAIEMLKVKIGMSSNTLVSNSTLSGTPNLVVGWNVERTELVSLARGDEDFEDELVDQIDDIDDVTTVEGSLNTFLTEYADDNLGVNVSGWQEYEIRVTPAEGSDWLKVEFIGVA